MKKTTSNRALRSVAAAAVALLASTATHAVDLNGYLRVGPGQKTTTGDDRDCYDAQAGDNTFGHGGVGRLGNECDTYGEFKLSQGGNAGGIEYKASIMSYFFRGGSDVGDENVGIKQAWVQAKGFDFAPELSFWIGKRFGDRAYVFYDDYFPINMTGTGAGVDGIKVGSATFDLAVYRDRDETPNPGSRLNADMKGIPVNPGGTLRVTGVATSFSGTGGQNGYGLSLQHDQARVLGGSNTIWLQYAQGSAESNMAFANATDGSDVKRWRFVEAIQWTEGPLTGQAMLRLGSYGPSASRVMFSSVGGHAAYAFTRHFKLRTELGVGQIKPEGGPTQRLTKFTVAPTIGVGPDYYDRPELRFYVSRFGWNDAYAQANGLTRSDKTAAGIQAEIWF